MTNEEARKPAGADPVVEKGMVVYRPDPRPVAVSDDEARDLATQVTVLWPDDLKGNTRLAMTIAKVAIAYKLDPFLNEITVYRGKPFFPLEGRLRIAQNNEETFLGIAARPATEEERKAWGCAGKEHVILWRAEASRSDWIDPATGHPRIVTGWGEVNTLKDSNPVARDKPNQQAEVRATKRALRTLYSAPLPFQDLPDADEPDRDVDFRPSRWVDPTTGEILDQRPGGNSLTEGQRAAIHTMCKDLGIDQNRRHQLLEAMFQKESTSQLNEGEAAAFIEWLGYRLRPNVVEVEDPRAKKALFAPDPKADQRVEPSDRTREWLAGTRGVKSPGETAGDQPAKANPEPKAPDDAASAEAVELDRSPTTEQDTEEASEVPAQPTQEAKSGEGVSLTLPKALEDGLEVIVEESRTSPQQPWWEDEKRVSENKASVRRYLKGPGLKYSDEAIAVLYRLLTIAAMGYDPGAADAEKDLSPAFIPTLQMHKPELASIKEGLDMVRLEGLLDK